MKIEIQVASISDRTSLVAELWLGSRQVAEVSNEHGYFEIETYESLEAIRLDDYLEALQKARRELE